MIARVDEARNSGDTVGGIFEVVVTGLPIGLGSHVHWDRRLDAALAGAVVSIPIVKGVEFGLGFEQTRLLGWTSSRVAKPTASGTGPPTMPAVWRAACPTASRS
jgi:chorismate synthase